MNNRKWITVSVFSCICLLQTQSGLFAQGTFTVKNDTNYYLELWVYRHTIASWVPFRLPSGASRELTAVTPGLCTLVAREPPANDHRIGVYDLTKIAADNPKAELHLSEVLQAMTKTVLVRDQFGNVRQVQKQVTVSVFTGSWSNVKEFDEGPLSPKRPNSDREMGTKPKG
jgi:hypothetical protein